VEREGRRLLLMTIAENNEAVEAAGWQLHDRKWRATSLLNYQKSRIVNKMDIYFSGDQVWIPLKDMIHTCMILVAEYASQIKIYDLSSVKIKIHDQYFCLNWQVRDLSPQATRKIQEGQATRKTQEVG
jgi:hypothetical protein